jgi:transcriptional regulator with GAF, ATPase, and Fis domain
MGCDTLLITGETGVGKEVLAREIHFTSMSGEDPFIVVNCPALTDTLAESELFGHVKGSFTGATADRAGYFELADGGTLFLDEVGDLSPSAQAMLLRVIETRTFRRIGGSKEIKVQMRVIAATNAPLDQRVEEGQFRRDLFYRLNVYRIHLLPLRERKDDIVPLAEHFLTSYANAKGLKFEGFSEEAKEALLSYDFPGNARELRNIVERAAILCGPGLITPEHLNLQPVLKTSPAKPEEMNGERSKIVSALEQCDWNRRKAAEILDMPYSTLRYKILKLDIKELKTASTG